LSVSMDYNNFLKELKTIADPKYAAFQGSLVPGMKEGFILGVKIPEMRRIGREIAKSDAYGFLKAAKDNSYEEIFIQGVVIGQIKTENFGEFCDNFNAYIEKINNWALCDGFCAGLKEVKKYRAELLPRISECTRSHNPWNIRVGLVLLLSYYLDGEYIDEALRLCDAAACGEYYVSMARAWLVAEALAKCPKQTLSYIMSNSLDKKTFNRAVQKCVESRRIAPETKEFLKTLKRY